MNLPQDIKMVDFSQDQYIPEETKKSIIVIHHTAGGSAMSSIDGWKQDTSKIATHVVIDRDGTIYQCFSSKYWAWHLGLKEEVFHQHGLQYQNLDKISLSIELANYGEVHQKQDKKWYNAYNGIIKGGITIYSTSFKEVSFFESYTSAQIESLKQLILFWSNKFNIPLDYHQDMWDVSNNALKGTSGIWTHVSFRKDKSDCHPQSNLIEMLKSLKPVS